MIDITCPFRDLRPGDTFTWNPDDRHPLTRCTKTTDKSYLDSSGHAHRAPFQARVHNVRCPGVDPTTALYPADLEVGP